MSTKFSLCAVMMELSARMEAVNARMEVHWTPRERNEEADALANFETKGFSEEHRVQLELQNMDWYVLPEMLEFGQTFQEERKQAKEADRHKPKVRKRKRRKEDKLRVVDPW